jgi:hypothetical protein
MNEFVSKCLLHRSGCERCCITVAYVFVASEWVKEMLYHCGVRVCGIRLGERDVASLWHTE